MAVFVQSHFNNFNANDTYSPISLYDDQDKLIFTLQPNRPIEHEKGQYDGKVARAEWNGLSFYAQATGIRAFVPYTPVAVQTPKDGKQMIFLGYGLTDRVIFVRN